MLLVWKSDLQFLKLPGLRNKDYYSLLFQAIKTDYRPDKQMKKNLTYKLAALCGEHIINMMHCHNKKWHRIFLWWTYIVLSEMNAKFSIMFPKIRAYLSYSI